MMRATARPWGAVIAVGGIIALLGGATAQNPIVNITQPTAGATFYYGQRLNLSFVVTQQYAAQHGLLSVELFLGGSSTACPIVRYPYTIPTDQTFIQIDVPTCAAPSDRYQISLGALPNYQRLSAQFTLAVRAGAACRPGLYDANDGQEPGCIPCPIGTYWLNPRTCGNCPAGMSTHARGSTAVGACNRTIVNASNGFIKFDKTFFYHSNAGGLNLIEYDHKTQLECMALCNQDPGCKAFDSGDPAQFQRGDCFLSYDTPATIKTGDVRFVNQLELFLKIERQTAHDVFFRKLTGCYIRESNDGGVFRDEHSPEACAELCLNDGSCLSYDAGQVRGDPTGQSRWITSIDDCYLSYENRSQVPTSDVVCSSTAGLDYYERVIPRYFEISAVMSSVVPTWNQSFQTYLPNNRNFTIWNDNRTGVARMNSLRCACNRRSINGIGNACQFWGTPRGYGLANERWCHVNPSCNAAERNPVPGVANAFWARCFTNVPLPCPVVWNQTTEVVDRYPFLRDRTNFIDVAKQAIASAMTSVSPDVLAARLEATSNAVGVAPNPATMTLTVNVKDINAVTSADQQFAAAFTVNQARTLTIAGRSYQVTQRNAVPCANGFVSQSGYTPGCFQCPPNSVSNRPRTNCVPCPLGTESDAGQYDLYTANSTGIKACQPSFNSADFNLGVFRLGYEWSGYYFGPLGIDGQGRTGSGAITIKVTKSEFLDSIGGVHVEVLVRVHHGEDCPPRRNCRDPGVTQYFANAEILEGASEVEFVKNTSGNSWHGITDRNIRLFYPGNLRGRIQVLNRNNVFNGTFQVPTQGDGRFVMWERCYASEEAGGLLPGNKFVGTYACYRPGTNMTAQTTGNDPCLASREGNLPELDVRRLELTVVENANGTVSAEIGLDFPNGRGQYGVTGVYQADTGAIEFNAAQGAWISAHPTTIPARQFSGRLSDNGEALIGQYNVNPNCACNGTALGGQGATCTTQPSNVDNRINGPWCTVGPACPDGRPVRNMAHTFVATCNVQPNLPASTTNAMQTCSDVVLYRVCSASPPLCEAGWQYYPDQFRCYLSSLRLTNQTTMNYTAAREYCENRNAHLVSIHSNGENNFVRGMIGGQPAWTGLENTSGRVGWHDNTPYSFSALQPNVPGTSPCGSLLPNSRWRFSDCSVAQPFVCRKVPIGRNTTNCECNGARDAQHRGGYCNFWDGPTRDAWCYGSHDCPAAVLQNSNLSRVPCYSGLGATTTRPPTAAPPPPIGCAANQYQVGQACRPCLTAANCNSSNREVISGSCGQFTGPQCAVCPSNYNYVSTSLCSPCDSRCGTCAGQRPTDCTSCVRNSSLYLFNITGVRGACVPTCHTTGQYFKDNSTQRCVRCFTPSSSVDRNIAPCGEFTDTRCNSQCPAGYQHLSNGCCDRCVPGVTFNDQAGSGTCRPVSTSCSPGQYLAGPATLAADIHCVGCTLGTNFNVNGTGGSCTPVRQCSTGQGQLSPPTTSSDRQCQSCPLGSFSDGSAPCQAFRLPCDPGTGQTVGPTTTTDRVCTPCGSGSWSPGGASSCMSWAPQCSAGQFQDTAPTSSGDRSCVACPTGTYQANANTNSQCTPTLGPCGAGQQIASAVTPTSERTCQSCAVGSSFSTGNGPCTGVTPPCGPGTEQSSAPTTTSDRVCTPCVAGVTYRPLALTRCIAVTGTVCPPGQVLVSAPTTTSDIVCRVTTTTTATTTTTVVTATSATTTQRSVLAQQGGEGGGGDDNLIPIIVVILVVIIIVGAIVWYGRRESKAKVDSRVAFDNPVYAHTSDGFNPAPDDEAYTELGAAIDDGGGVEESGYMDVGGAGEEPGYLDTAPEPQDDDADDV